MKKQDNLSASAQYLYEREKMRDHRYAPYRAPLPNHVIDAMPIVVTYIAKVGRVEHFKRGEELVFVQTYAYQDGRVGEEWDDIPESAYAIRDEFFKIKKHEQAQEFLQKTGRFSPLRERFTWSEFQKWQHLARLVQEHNELATAMREKKWSGEYAEVLKALSGMYPSSFFDGCESALYLHDHTEENLEDKLQEAARRTREASNHEEWLSAFQNQSFLISAENAKEEWAQKKKQHLSELVGWFRRPPVSIEWDWNSHTAKQEVLKTQVDTATGIELPIPEESPIMHGGAMIEYLLRQDQLRPVLLIAPRTTLQAIAAAIFADRVKGTTYRKCVVCGDLFGIEKGRGNRKVRKYCGKRCFGNAHKKRQRAKKHNREALPPDKDKAKRRSRLA